MKCLLKYQWVKLPRNTLPDKKGIMGYWAKLASRAAFRNGVATYCGYENHVSVGTWSGGMVGLKAILQEKSKSKVLLIMHELSKLGYISFSLNPTTKKLVYKIRDWVVQCSGADCCEGTVYTTEGYGFLCLPRNITERLVQRNHRFEEDDAWLDLWCHTVFQDPRNAFSYMAPAVQFGKYGAALTLEKLGQRWRWEKTKVWRFLQKHGDVFALYKLPGSFGCLIFNKLYPTDAEFALPKQDEIIRILHEIRILGENTYSEGTEHQRINRLINWYSKRIRLESSKDESEPFENDSEKSRVAVSPYIIRAYFSQCWNCKKYINDCWVTVNNDPEPFKKIRGPCTKFRERFPSKGESP